MADVRVVEAKFTYQPDGTSVTAEVTMEVLDDQGGHSGTLAVTVQAQSAEDGLAQAKSQAHAIGLLLAASK
ncbi:MAG TPA: hypothetical protein VG248_00015 [Caulobacteraceae bacterium]|jgi:hypothetical protein|nr:hypothetical protein [Caulobacteraceae bacterium]